MQYVAFAAQLVYYFGLAFAAIFAAVQFKRLVDSAAGVTPKAAKTAEVAAADAKTADVTPAAADVDKFVE